MMFSFSHIPTQRVGKVLLKLEHFIKHEEISIDYNCNTELPDCFIRIEMEPRKMPKSHLIRQALTYLSSKS